MTLSIAGAAALVLATPVAAQQGWSDTIAHVSPVGVSTGDVQVAADPSGNVTAVWLQASPPSGFVVMASRGATAGGTWGPSLSLSPAGLLGADLAVAADDSGGALAVWTTSDGVHAARYAPGTGHWDADATVASRASAHRPEVAVDPSGNAVAVWCLDGASRVEAARYDVGSHSWTGAIDLSAGADPDVAVDRAGNALAVWSSLYPRSEVQSARYTAATSTWSAPITLLSSGVAPGSARVAVDATGNATAVWSMRDIGSFKFVLAFRYDAGAWSAPVVLATVYSLDVIDGLDLSANAAGDVAVIWSGLGQVHYRRYTGATGRWSAQASVMLPAPCPQCHTVERATGLRVAIDATGQAFMAWSLRSSGRVQAGRFSGAGPAATPAFLTDPHLTGTSPQIVVDPSGTGMAVWSAWSPNTGILSSRWLAVPREAVITDVVPASGALSIAFSPPITAEAAFSPVTYDYSLDDGVTWTARTPASVTSPLDVTGLTSGVPYQIRLRAVNDAGAGAASLPATATPGPAPGPPVGLVVTAMAGNVVTLSWLAPANSTPPTGYVLEGGVLPGQVLASVPTGSVATVLTVGAPTGVFFIRMRAVAGAIASAPSNEIQVFVNVAAPPSAPAHLLGLVDGSTVALSWTNTFAAGAPTDLWLVVSGIVTGAAPLPVLEAVQFPGVPPGTYTLLLVATNASGVSPASNPVTLTVPGGCTGVPGPPTRFMATTAGRTVTLSWSPPETGAASTGYTLSVTGSVAGAIATTARTLAGTVPPGSYTFTVVATNPCGPSAGGPSQVVTVP